MHPVHQKAIKFIKTHRMLKPGSKVLVAFSGGADSVFLLDFLITFRKLFKIEVGALHLNHSIRGKEADADASFCRQFCDNRDVPFFLIKKNVPAYAKKNKLSVEEAARIIRYDILEQTARKNDYRAIATAHNIEDNSETMFLNMIKGAGLNGLSGIPLTRGNIIRPLLGVRKNDIVNYLESKRIPYCLDSTNDSVGYDRNFMRLIVLPQIRERFNPSLDETLLKTSQNISAYKDFIGNKIIPQVSELFNNEQKDILTFPLEKLKQYDEIIIGSVLQYLAGQKFGITLSNERIKEIIGLSGKRKGSVAELGNKVFAVRQADNISVEKVISRKQKTITLKPGDKKRFGKKVISITQLKKNEVKLSGNKSEEIIGMNKKPLEFRVRIWKEGDRFTPLGMSGTKLISDFLTDLKLDVNDRISQPLLDIDGEIAWVIGQRISDKFKLSDKSKYFYLLGVRDNG